MEFQSLSVTVAALSISYHSVLQLACEGPAGIRSGCVLQWLMELNGHVVMRGQRQWTKSGRFSGGASECCWAVFGHREIGRVSHLMDGAGTKGENHCVAIPASASSNSPQTWIIFAATSACNISMMATDLASGAMEIVQLCCARIFVLQQLGADM